MNCPHVFSHLGKLGGESPRPQGGARLLTKSSPLAGIFFIMRPCVRLRKVDAIKCAKVAITQEVSIGNSKLAGWGAFYKFTDYTARIFQRIDRVVFWKLAHWLARKYRSHIKPLKRKWCRVPKEGKAKTWVLFGISEQGNRIGKVLHRPVGSQKMQYRWRNPEINPYIKREENRSTITSRYRDVAMAMG